MPACWLQFLPTSDATNKVPPNARHPIWLSNNVVLVPVLLVTVVTVVVVVVVVTSQSSNSLFWNMSTALFKCPVAVQPLLWSPVTAMESSFECSTSYE